MAIHIRYKGMGEYKYNCWDIKSITFYNFDQNIECTGIHSIRYSKHQGAKNR